MSLMRRQPRGSALILVVLLTLILSATAIVALRDVARTVHHSAVYRTRTQAQLTSSAAAQLYARRAGDNAHSMVDAMQKSVYGKEGSDENVLGGAGSVDTTSVSFTQRRKILEVTGGHIEVQAEDLGGQLLPHQASGYDGTAAHPESGLFRSSSSERTFESRYPAQWRVIVRDLLDGFPAVGYSSHYCFKKATVAAEARVGEPDPDWSVSNNVAVSRTGVETLLGPVECGYDS